MFRKAEKRDKSPRNRSFRLSRFFTKSSFSGSKARQKSSKPLFSTSEMFLRNRVFLGRKRDKSPRNRSFRLPRFFTKSSSSGFVSSRKMLFFSEVVIPTLQGRSKSDLFYREKQSEMNLGTFRVFFLNSAFRFNKDSLLNHYRSYIASNCFNIASIMNLIMN